MPPPELQDRLSIARALRLLRQSTAALVTREFLVRHPDWVERYGTAASERGYEDALYHIDFLAGALEAGSVEAYRNYAVWTRRVLESRGISATFLAENLQQIEAAISEALVEPSRRIVREYIAAALDACREQSPEPDPGIEGYAAVYVQAVLDGQRHAAVNVTLEAMRTGFSVPALYMDLIQPAMYEIGRKWQRNEITVAQEHMATALTQFVLARLYELVDPQVEVRGRMIVTGVEGELHQLGALMVADSLEWDGWVTRFLGTNMPCASIVRAIDEFEAAVIGISVTMLFNIPKVYALIDAIKHRFPQLRILVGGAAFRLTPGLWREVGADAFAPDLATAVDAARQWANSAVD